jgi:hypothetical protein
MGDGRVVLLLLVRRCPLFCLPSRRPQPTALATTGALLGWSNSTKPPFPHLLAASFLLFPVSSNPVDLISSPLLHCLLPLLRRFLFFANCLTDTVTPFGVHTTPSASFDLFPCKKTVLSVLRFLRVAQQADHHLPGLDTAKHSPTQIPCRVGLSTIQADIYIHRRRVPLPRASDIFHFHFVKNF